MDDRRALMAAIIANPEEDTPRLALADWLQEHGDKHDRARAEFIRLQIEAHRLSETDPMRRRMNVRAEQLLTRHREHWLARLVSIDKRLVNTAHHADDFSRGLLNRLFMPTQTFLLKSCQQVLPDVLANLGVETLKFPSTTKREDALAESLALRWVARVIYSGGDKAITAFGRSPACTHLGTLEFADSEVTDTGLRRFAETATISNLRRFGLPLGAFSQPRRKYTAAGVVAVLESARFPSLDTLDLSGIQQQKFDHASLFVTPGLSRLVRLQIGGNVPMALVAACPHLTALRELSVDNSVIENDDVDVMLAYPALQRLEKLTLWEMNAERPRLSQRLHDNLLSRFGTGLQFDYSLSVNG